jgi:hypothetical protein
MRNFKDLGLGCAYFRVDQWKCNEKKEKNWEQVAFDDSKWQNAYLVAP